MSNTNIRRPKHLDLRKIRLPVGGVVSILHRISGVLLVLLLPLVLRLLQRSLQGPDSFSQVVEQLSTRSGRLLVLGVLLLLTHHFLAGVRHLLLDLDIGISRRASRVSAWLVLAGVVVAALLAGNGLLT